MSHFCTRPGGPNVYAGVPKDYTGAQVTPDNFLRLLVGGDPEGGLPPGAKTLDSGPDDHVFVYFADHGAPNMIMFPGGAHVSASQLRAANEEMRRRRRFGRMVYYVEVSQTRWFGPAGREGGESQLCAQWNVDEQNF